MEEDHAVVAEVGSECVEFFWFCGGRVNVVCSSCFEVVEEVFEGSDAFDFAEDEVGDALDRVIERSRVGSARDDGDVVCVGAVDHVFEGVFLRDHGGGEDCVGPVEVVVCEFFDVHVDEAAAVVVWKEGCDC